MSKAGVGERIFDRFEWACQKYPDKPAVIFLGESFSYSKLKEFIDRFATALYELGVRSGDKAILYTPNCPQWLISYLGLQKIGAVPVPISPIYTPYELEYMANNSKSETIICADTNFGYVAEILPKTKMKRVIVINIADMLSWWRRAFGKLFDKIPEGSVSRRGNIYFFRKLLKYPPHPPEVQVKGTDVAYVLYTGGTTGFPKGIASTHLFALSGFKDIMEMYERYIEEGKHVFVFAGPLFHMFWQDMLFSIILYRGNTCILMPRPNIDAILEAIQRHRATLFAGVPTLYRMILEHERFDMYNLNSLKYCWSAGDVLPIEVYKRWKEKVGVPIYQVYGSTELVIYSVSPLDDEDPAPPCVGVRMPSRLMRVVDPDTLKSLPPNTSGELLVSCDHIISGYLDRPDETEKSFVEIDGKLWFKTGDIVRMDEKGYLYFEDRVADTIKHKGWRISAAEVEAILQDHPAVVAACVVGVPDPKVGERIKAFVILKEDVRGIGAQDLIRWCRERLAPYKIPEYIEFRDMLPKSKVGKLLRREMRDEERRRVSKERKKG